MAITYIFLMVITGILWGITDALIIRNLFIVEIVLYFAISAYGAFMVGQ